MKLNARFIQLPLAFDAAKLAQEVSAFGDENWRPHPQGYAGNDFLPLIASGGDPANESFENMAPTPFLKACPYLIDTLASFGATLGRTRLMRLSGHSEVSPHVDMGYYWHDRVRIHVPIVTQPTVRFACGDQEINMAEGECWIFDTWSAHRVLNDAERSRVHLVCDTVGGEGFFKLMQAGKLPDTSPPGWSARDIKQTNTPVSALDLERFATPTVMSPWEARSRIEFLIGEIGQRTPEVNAFVVASAAFLHTWRSLWAAYGDKGEGLGDYRQTLDEFARDVKAMRLDNVTLKGGPKFVNGIFATVINVALADKAAAEAQAASPVRVS